MPKGVAHSYEFRLAMMRLHEQGQTSPAFAAVDLGRDEAGDFAVASTEAGPGSDRTARPDECQHRLPGARGGRAESLDPARAARRPAV